MSSPLKLIKEFEKTHPLPKVAVGKPISPEAARAQQKFYHDFPIFLEKLAAALIPAMTPEKNVPGLENAQNILDFSPASLVKLDEFLQKTDYPSWFTKDYLTEWFIPALGAYIGVVCARHIKNVHWKFAIKVEKCALQPPQGGRLFYFFALARDAVFSGYRTKEFFDRVATFTKISN